MSFPLRGLAGNLVINEAGEVWALYRLSPWHYEHLGTGARTALLWRLSRLFWDLEEYAGQLLIIPRPQPIAESLHRLTELVTGPLAAAAQGYAAEAAGRLATGRDGVVREHYLALRLPKSLPSQVPLSALFTEPKRFVDDLLGVGRPELLSHEITAYQEREEALRARVQKLVQATPVTVTEAAWLIQRSFWRGISEPPGLPVAPGLGSGAAGRTRLAAAEVQSLGEGELDLRNPRRILLTQDGDRTATSAFCALATLPDELLFPGTEWLYHLEDLSFPVEVCLRWHALPHEAALAAVRQKRLEILDQDEHTRTSGEEVPIALQEAQEQVLLLEHDLKQRRFPQLQASLWFALAAPDEARLYEQIRALKSYFATYQITIEVPTGDQLQGFLAALPGAPNPGSDYTHRLPPEVLAGAMFLGTRAIGDATGPYLGRAGVLGRPVFLDPVLPPMLNRSASIAFLGSLGGGKSFAANLLTYLAVLFGGAQALVLDPKGERTGWVRDLPELEGHVKIITLGTNPADRGKLDPFLIGRDGGPELQQEAANLALSLLAFLANIAPSDPRFLPLMTAVEQVAASPKPGLGRVVEHLWQSGEHDRNAQGLATYFRSLSRLAYAHLIFGEGDEAGLDIEAALNVLQLQNLVMPPAGKPREEYSLEESLSVALMHAVTGFATQFTRRERDRFKIVLLDEAWALMASTQGRMLVTHLLRTGRAMNNAVYLVSQNVADLLDETVRSQIGIKFIFRSFDPQEITKVLQFLGLEAEPETIAALRQLETGQALLQDLQGRVGVVTLDPLFPHLATAFDTRPVRRGAP